MRWVRSQLKIGAWCALFALAAQLVLSFGHVHVPKIANGLVAAAALADGSPTADAAGKPPVPAKQKSHNLGDDFCAICSLMHLASSVLPATGPSLPLPLLAKKVHVTTRLEIARAAPPSLPFQARAPPQA